MMKINKEKRYYNIEFRAEKSDDGKRKLIGYGALFNHRSKLIYEFPDDYFYEEIREGAFDDVLNADNLDVALTYNHNQNEFIARYTRRNGKVIVDTLKLSVDNKGLRYEVDDLPNTTLSNDLYEQIQRGNLFESSFIFTVKREDIEFNEVEELDAPLRIINKINSLHDVSVVYNGAYDLTDVEVAGRELKEFKNEKQDDDVNNEDNNDKINLIKMKMRLLELN